MPKIIDVKLENDGVYRVKNIKEDSTIIDKNIDETKMGQLLDGMEIGMSVVRRFTNIFKEVFEENINANEKKSW